MGGSGTTDADSTPRLIVEEHMMKTIAAGSLALRIFTIGRHRLSRGGDRLPGYWSAAAAP